MIFLHLLYHVFKNLIRIKNILVSLYMKDLCHSPLPPFQTEKDASHISITHAFLCSYFKILYFLYLLSANNKISSEFQSHPQSIRADWLLLPMPSDLSLYLAMLLFFQLLQERFFPFSGCLIYVQKMFSISFLQKHHLISYY